MCGTLTRRRGTVVLAAAVVAFAALACADDPSSPPASPASATAVLTPPVPGTPELQPLQRFTVAPGETLDVQGAGFFFLDIATGAIEGWGVSQERFAGFPILGISDDGRWIVLACSRERADSVCLLDSESGEKRRLPGFDDNIALSPDGSLIAAQSGTGAVFSWAQPEGRGPLPVSAAADVTRVVWAPDSRSLLLRHQSGDGSWAVLDVLTGTLDELPQTAGRSLSWSPAGDRIMSSLMTEFADVAEITALDRSGAPQWSYSRPDYMENPRWSPDGRLIALQTTDAQRVARVHVLDAATGAERMRINGAFACAGRTWNADGSALLVLGYRTEGDVVVDVSNGATTLLPVGVVPSPYDPRVGVFFDGEDFSTVRLDTGEQRPLARTTVHPAWDFVHEPLFAGGRIFATFPHLGHGGCLEGQGPDTPPDLSVEFPPFAD
jgi:hypothetical protein